MKQKTYKWELVPEVHFDVNDQSTSKTKENKTKFRN